MALASAYKSEGLTLKQKLFCEHYLSNGGNRSDAVYKALYNPNNSNTAAAIGSENLRKPSIKKYLESRVKEAVDKAGVGLDWRLNMLKKVAEATSNEEMVGLSSRFDGGVAIKAVTEMNKMDGSYAPVASSVSISESNLKDAEEIAVESEKEINEIKSF